jgi:GTPase SAR1 family protein
MHEKNIELLRDEAQRLLRVEIDLLTQMKNEPGVVTEGHAGEHQTFTSDSIAKDIEVLKGELAKLENLEMVLAVVGTMKAGKSTTINAIVGTEVLPNRNRPMTALPTLIRHTPGQFEPVLKFANSEPINDLMRELGRTLDKESAKGAFVTANTDMATLLTLIRGKARFKNTYQGADSIFKFLKTLNDLVRLSADLGVDFPFDSYDEVHEMPVIEVEFAHLDDTQHSGGRLTLLDTPGPNESGQPHLRAMLTEQLQKASAVLAVLDFTQLKSDADEQVRQELKDIASIAKGRLFTLVNKFDQRDRHGDTAEQVQSFVADTLMEGLLKPTDVFPVSSRWGYLANRAKHEIALRKTLPNHVDNPWVVDFAEEALGRRWESKLDDTEEVISAAKSLWEDSLFTNPLKNVIQTAHASAAAFALDSAASKLIHTAEAAGTFLGVRKTALEKSSKALLAQISSLKSDIAKIESIKSQTEADAKQTLADIEGQTRTIFKKIKSDTEADIDSYFKEGKRIEGKQAEARQKERREAVQHGSLLSSLLGALNGRLPADQRSPGKKSNANDQQDFDPTSSTVKFDSAEDAEKLVSKIQAAVSKDIAVAEQFMVLAMQQILVGFEKNFAMNVILKAQQIIDGLNHRMASDGFSVTVKIPDASSLALNLNAIDTLTEMVNRQEKQVTRYRRSSGAWGTVCSWFNSSDWGWDEYKATEAFFEVDIKQIKAKVSKSITSVFDGLNDTIARSIETPLNATVDNFFAEFIKTVEQIRGDLLQGIRDQESSKSEQEELKQRLKGLTRFVPAILADSKELKDDAKTMHPVTEGVLA